MKRGKARTILILLASLVLGSAALVLVAIGVLYVLGERVLNQVHDYPLADVDVSADPATLAEGERLASITGCRGCHRPDLSGHVFFDGGALVGRAVASNLSVVAEQYADAQLAHTIRYGRRPDGRAMLGMPSSMYYHLADQDLAAIIAYLRSVPAVEKALPATRLGPLGRLALLSDELPLDAAMIARMGPRLPPPDPGDAVAWGRYIALTSCTECHGLDLRGHVFGDGHAIPGLAIAAAYSDAQFIHFMRTGEALGNRELELMSDMSRERFSHLTDDEIQALHAFLRTLGAVD